MASFHKHRALVLGLAALVVACTATVESLARMQDRARLASCRPRVIFCSAAGYAKAHDGFLPPLSPIPGKFAFDAAGAKEFAWNAVEYVCEYDATAPSRAELVAKGRGFDDWSYAYLGYFLENEVQGMAFLDAYERTLASGGAFTEVLGVPPGTGNLGGDVIHRLRLPAAMPQGLTELAAKANAIPIAVEWPGHHRRMGGKVVYLDGHEEYLRYPGPWPMTEAFIEGLRELDAAGDGKASR